jgi:hypothetical protein
MEAKQVACMLLTLCALAGLGACDNERETTVADEVLDTGFPGQVTAGGGTSGEVIAADGRVVDTLDPSGTPGIPKGAGGTVGGAKLGGTTEATGGATGTPPPPGVVPPGAEPMAEVEEPSGTPGIPEGAGGNPGGAALGGTTEAQAETMDGSNNAGVPSRPK